MGTFSRELWAMFVDCPADELGPCYFYEYSRESKSLRDACAKTRPAVPPGAANGFEYYLASPWSAAQGELMTDPARVFMLWPEWPDQPYLQIPAEERRRRLRWSAKDDPRVAHLKKLSFLAMTQISPEGLRPLSPAGATNWDGRSIKLTLRCGKRCFELIGRHFPMLNSSTCSNPGSATTGPLHPGI
jgi:hypothetical protein